MEASTELLCDKRVIGREEKEIVVAADEVIRFSSGCQIDVRLILFGPWEVKHVRDFVHQHAAEEQSVDELLDQLVIQARELRADARILHDVAQFFQYRAA